MLYPKFVPNTKAPMSIGHGHSGIIFVFSPYLNNKNSVEGKVSPCQHIVTKPLNLKARAPDKRGY